MAKFKDILDGISSLLELPGKISAFLIIAVPIVTSLIKIDPILEIRASILIVTIAITGLVAHVGPKFFRKYRLISLSNNAVTIWNKMKSVIREFHSPTITDKRKIELELKYKRHRRELIDIVAFNQEKILSALEPERPGATRYAPIVKSNFENCFFAETLSDWSNHCKRNINHELNSFDSLAAKISTFN